MAKATHRKDAETLQRENRILLARYIALVQQWNRHVDLFNEHVPRPMGRRKPRGFASCTRTACHCGKSPPRPAHPCPR